MPLNRSLEMTRTILQICSFAQQKRLRFVRTVESKLPTRLRSDDAVLHFLQLYIEDLLQVVSGQSAKDHNLIDAVHKLRRKLALRHLKRCPIQLVIEGLHRSDVVSHPGSKPDTSALEHVRHFDCSEIGSHEDYTPRQVHSAVVAKSQGAFV